MSHTMNRRGFVGSMLGVSSAMLAACKRQNPQNNADSQASESKQAEPTKLAIIHTNDTHGYDRAEEGVLGMAAVAQLKKDYLAKGYDVLLMDAGDAMQGNLLVNSSEGAVTIDIMNAVGYDVMCAGNHDFDYGSESLLERVDGYNFPVIAANIIDDSTKETLLETHTVFTLSNGFKVGVFGLTTPETRTKASPKHTVGLSFLSEEELYACAQKETDELRKEGCGLVVCLAHLGENDMSAPNRAIDVAQHISGIDLIIDGHDHKVENQAVANKAGEDTLIVETGCFLANIGVVTFENEALSASLVAAGEYEGLDAAVVKLIDGIAADIDDIMGVKIGESAYTLNGQRDPGVRTEETNLGDLCTDAFLWMAQQVSVTTPVAAVLQGGAIRDSIKAGDVTLGDIHTVFPFNNQLVTLEVSGDQLLEALEAATAGTPDAMGAFPQVAGIVYTINTKVPYEKGVQYPNSTYFAPAKPGSRVTIESVAGEPFDPKATYVLATSEFLGFGGDTYYVFAEAAFDSIQFLGYLDYEAFQNYFDELGNTIPDRYAETQKRITVIV